MLVGISCGRLKARRTEFRGVQRALPGAPELSWCKAERAQRWLRKRDPLEGVGTSAGDAGDGAQALEESSFRL